MTYKQVLHVDAGCVIRPLAPRFRVREPLAIVQAPIQCENSN